MSEVKVPDIGDFDEVPVIEIHVSEGDEVEVEQPLVTLESDKATMDVPSPEAGTVKEILVSVNDKVSEGTPLLKLEGGDGGDAASDDGDSDEDDSGKDSEDAPEEVEEDVPSQDSTGGEEEDVPSGQESAGARASDAEPSSEATETEESGAGSGSDAAETDEPTADEVPDPKEAAEKSGGTIYAGPGVRRLARELGVELSGLKGSGRKGRILREDVITAKDQPAKPAQTDAPVGIPGLNLAPWPKVDFEKYGEVERVALSRVKKISGPALSRNWVMIPHVTHNDEADITDLEAFRKQVNSEQSDVKVTMVALLMKACVGALRQFPEFNSSLDGDELVIKRYFNIGFAADTPQGLLVPVIKEADRKGLLEIAGELTELSGKAREGKISAEEMRGSTFTISSLGGIGGTSFTPIINAPEVAILGVTRSKMQPVWDKEAEEFKPRLMVPLSLSYDHRVIDGAAAARFTAHLATELADIRRALL